jgi:hypothetical protein
MQQKMVGDARVRHTVKHSGHPRFPCSRARIALMQTIHRGTNRNNMTLFTAYRGQVRQENVKRHGSVRQQLDVSGRVHAGAGGHYSVMEQNNAK